MAMGYRLVPRFAGRPLRLPWSTIPVLVLLCAGLTLRTVAQPLLDLPGMRALLLAGALAEAAAAVLFCAAVIATLAPGSGGFAPAPLLMLGALGFAAQATLGLVLLAMIPTGDLALPAARDRALLSVQFSAFLLPFVLGVASRALPSFFKYRAAEPRLTWAIAGALGAGAALQATAARPLAAVVAARLEAAGGLLVATGALGGAALTGVWRPPERLRTSARDSALLLRTAFAWLAVAALWLGVISTPALLTGRPAPAAHIDGIRHTLALGVVTTLILGMGQLVLPWLAMRRPRRGGGGRANGRALWALLLVATALRVAGALLEGRAAPEVRYGMMGLAGLLGFIAVAWFATSILRAARVRPPEIPLHLRPE
ncbi:MAG: hypothetical protein U0531_12045 [Dehalococcoidia bacterium]